MKVSIVTAVVNQEEFIEDCVKSVLSQDYDNIEYIIIDGQSTDKTLEIIQGYRHSIDIFLSEKDDGMYHALNKGMELATGDIIGILNADDFFAGFNVISSVVDCFIEKRCDAVYGNLDMVRRNYSNTTLRKWRSKQYRLVDLKLGWMPAHPAFYVKKAIVNKCGAYCPEFGISADYELLIRLLYRHCIDAVFLSQILVYMRSNGISNGSPVKFLRTLVTDFKALKKHKIPFPFLVAIIKKIRKIGQYR